MIARDILHVASPSMRPPWSGPQHKPMTKDEICVLMLALAEDGHPLRYKAVFAIMGERCLNILNNLKRQGAVDHAGYNDWRITEKGRIAAALAMAKDPELAAAFATEEPKKTGCGWTEDRFTTRPDRDPSRP